MNQILQPGQTAQVNLLNSTCKVGKFLGSGGQGEVYEADVEGKPYALKWYFPHMATQQQRDSIEKLIKKGAPDDRFLWPTAMVNMPGAPSFGYIMPLRSDKFKSIVDLMKRRIEPDPSFYHLSRAGFALADSFLQLHAKGYSYRDISFGNVFFDPDTGDILICDNDNVAVDNETKSEISGTPRFMAPEIVRGEASPSTQTDLFSLAVLLFYMLFIHHPLEGQKELAIKCLDLPAMRKLYGDEPVYIFDPKDKSNATVEHYHDNAIAFQRIYPQFLLDLFEKSFTVGLHDVDKRVRESEWRKALIQLQDSVIYCGQCGAEGFYDVEKLKATGSPGQCWSCQAELSLPFRIRINGQIVMLNKDTRLYPHHTGERPYDFSNPIAQVAQHPKDARLWGLQNLSATKWTTTAADGTLTEIAPGKNVSLAKGRKIHFGNSEGEIQF